MSIKYSPSINLGRDMDLSLAYTPTANAKHVFEQIGTSLGTGKHSFVVIGSYGTGKSSFLWALSQEYRGKQAIFSEPKTPKRNFKILNLLGQMQSFRAACAELLGLDEDADVRAILKALAAHYEASLAQGYEGLLFIVDEFGKFLEYASKYEPELEMYFVQQIAEWANHNEQKSIFLTTLHQPFEAYGLELKPKQKKEWEKVKGRLSELGFNEPVEQLLHLAALRIAQDFGPKQSKKTLKQVVALKNLVQEANLFPLRTELSDSLAQQLAPLDVLAASILTLGLQKYGQNERSLFSFINSHDHKALYDFCQQDGQGIYSVDKVYDYLISQYYYVLNSKQNASYMQWAGIKAALNYIDFEYENPQKLQIAQGIIKLIGLLQIFAPSQTKLSKQSILHYGSLAWQGADSALIEEVLEELEFKHRVLTFRKLYQKYVFTHSSSLDIEHALAQAEGSVLGTDIYIYIYIAIC